MIQQLHELTQQFPTAMARQASPAIHIPLRVKQVRCTSLNHFLTCINKTRDYPTSSPLVPPVLPRKRRRHDWRDVLDEETLALPRTQVCFGKIELDEKLDFDLPKKRGMLAGQIMKHCWEAVDSVLEKQQPCIYKVGYTHCASFRWHNKVFGYGQDREKWEKMIVIYAAKEPISPAFVEGALIQRHKGFLKGKFIIL